MPRPKNNEKASRPPATQGKLGTFAGVFTPSILTILGIILFLRVGFVVGQAGLLGALVIVVLANTISVLTSFSLAAIATNFRVKGGGDYYLISRTLGPEFGGAIGIVLFLAQAVSIGFYAIGFGEAAAALMAWPDPAPQVVAAAAVGALFVLAWLGADWATRFQFGIMAVLFAALVAFLYGAFASFDGQVLAENWAPGGAMPFWTVFALFFPAVTGFTQGVSLSGELRDPARSLPSGTFLAVGISAVVYLGVAVLFAGSLPGSELIADYGAMGRIAIPSWTVTAGVFSATLSSALASFLGAPRILQALARDRLFPFLTPFEAGHGKTANPRRAVLLSLVIALGTVAMGELNLIAPVVSMFFLVSYGLLNYATYVEARAKSPAFRPRFRWYHERASLAGCLACAGVMVAIDPRAGVVAFGVLLLIHRYLAATIPHSRWSDSSRSGHFQAIRRHLNDMTEIVEHDRDWRPVVLAFSDDPRRRARIARFGAWIEGGSGLTTIVRVLTGQGPAIRDEARRLEKEMRAEVRGQGLDAFARVVVAPDPASGFPVLLQAAGLGSIRPNIALFNWYDREEVAEDAPAMSTYGTWLRTSLRFGCNVIVLAARRDALQQLEQQPRDKRRIDVFWDGDASSRLALLLGYLMTRGEAWSEARLRAITLAGAGEDAAEVEASLRATLEEARIRAEAVVIPGGEWSAALAAMGNASLALVPFRLRQGRLLDVHGEPLPDSLEGLPPMALVLAAQDVPLESQPDEGLVSDLARAADSSREAAKAAEERAAEAEKLGESVTALQAEQQRLQGEGAAAEELEQVARSLAEAERAAADARRRLAKAEAKARHSAEELRALGGEAQAPARPPEDGD